MSSPTIPEFLSIFPEFDDPKYTAIQFWLNIALESINQKRWGTKYVYGTYLLLAHLLSLSPTPTETDGLLTSSNVDGVQYSLDVATITNEGAALYNKTKYGIQYYQLAKVFAIGPLMS